MRPLVLIRLQKKPLPFRLDNRRGIRRSILRGSRSKGIREQLQQQRGALMGHRNPGVHRDGRLPGPGVTHHGRGKIEDDGAIETVEYDMIGENRRHGFILEIEFRIGLLTH